MLELQAVYPSINREVEKVGRPMRLDCIISKGDAGAVIASQLWSDTVRRFVEIKMTGTSKRCCSAPVMKVVSLEGGRLPVEM